MHQAVDNLPAAVVEVKKAVKVKKAAKVKAVKAVKVVKVKIDVKALVIPKDAELKILGTCTKIIGKNGHGYLKGCTLEISNPDLPGLKDRQDPISKAHAEKYHLGKSKAFIRKIASTEDLQAILNIYLG